VRTKLVTLEDVAKKAGVSITTVSHVINKTRYVKRETREFVLKTLEEMNYDTKKQKAKGRSSGMIAVIVADITEDYYIALVKAIETYASEKGFSILLCDSEDDYRKEERNIESILEKDVDGLIISPVNSERYPRPLRDASVPMLFVDRKYKKNDRVFVGINNYESGYIGSRYLASKGCASIGFIGYPNTVYTVHQREVGYRSFLQECLPDCEPRVLNLNYRQEDSNRLISEFIESAHPDGVLCATSDVCYQLIGSLGELGVSIPAQMKVVTYDDNKWLDYLKYPISVITQPTAEIGVLATETLLRMMLDPEERKNIGTDIFLETGFIDRL